MTTSSNQLKKIADAFRVLADAIEGIEEEEQKKVEETVVGPVVETENKEDAQTTETVDVESAQAVEPAPVEEAFLETATETVEVEAPAPEPVKRTVEEARAIVAKALKAGLRSEAKAIVSKYGASVSEIGEKTPENLSLLYSDIEAILEGKNA